ncbi:hypothetical protein NC653_041136 [Populus alba x Populus x berolinensis]|uniref:Uncharacterized protein n=1 Tax=Populus alba x Populus x berolinensis TaxID=444605 RepID=A0AAD6L836_9ROSI|nr:hypothetical protein NC653_041136 [Populus alba x Populus x berolinensis]
MPEELDTLAERYPSRFTVYYVLNQILRCGPPPMNKAMTALLEGSLGMNKAMTAHLEASLGMNKAMTALLEALGYAPAMMFPLFGWVFIMGSIKRLNWYFGSPCLISTAKLGAGEMEH